jgi:hypothetical protein
MEDKPLVLMTHDLPPDWVENSLNDFRVIFGDNDQRGIENKLEEYSVCWMIQFRQPLSIKLPFLKLSAIWLLAQIMVMAGIAIRNLKAGIQGAPLPFCVNPEVYKPS